jgi:hypothetical protein
MTQTDTERRPPEMPPAMRANAERLLSWLDERGAAIEIAREALTCILAGQYEECLARLPEWTERLEIAQALAAAGIDVPGELTYADLLARVGAGDLMSDRELERIAAQIGDMVIGWRPND